MPIFKYHDSPVVFEDDYLGTGMTRVSTLAHGELGFIWETPNGAWSASLSGTGQRAHRIGNSAVALSWLVEHCQKGKTRGEGA